MYRFVWRRKNNPLNFLLSFLEGTNTVAVDLIVKHISNQLEKVGTVYITYLFCLQNLVLFLKVNLTGFVWATRKSHIVSILSFKHSVDSTFDLN